MCGISGILSQNIIEGADLKATSAMSAALSHRGPDSEGSYSDSHVALEHRRLSIIDLEGGSQPLYSVDRNIVLVVNGEIYNYVELRRELLGMGFEFQTSSDSEVIIPLYQKYGLDCLSHLRGMFAFALWDTSKKMLFLARDRMGEKPLYLYQQQDRLIFSSEMKSLLKSGLVPFELNPASVDDYFHYLYVPEPETVLKGVRKLPAGHYVTVDVQNWHINEKKYWAMGQAAEIKADPVEVIANELDRVSELIIRSDVPVAVALSGGLDSSAIATLAAKKSSSGIEAFTVGYQGTPPSDERADAKMLADHLKIKLHQVELSVDEMVDFFPELVYLRDDPIADISGHGYYALNRAASDKGFPVLIQGQGADELFWGYPWVREAVRLTKLKSNYHPVKSLLSVIPPQMCLPEQYDFRNLAKWCLSCAGFRKGLKQYRLLSEKPDDSFVFLNISEQYRTAMKYTQASYSDSFKEQLGSHSPSDGFSFPRPWGQIELEITELICRTYLMGNGVTQADRLSMSSSVESRLPFLDYQLIEKIIGLRKTQTDYHLQPKAWLKAALSDVVPEWVTKRPKRGFEPPIRQWYEAIFKRHGHLLKDGYLQSTNIFTEKSLLSLSKGNFRDLEHSLFFFKALVLELWCRKMSELC